MMIEASNPQSIRPVWRSCRLALVAVAVIAFALSISAQETVPASRESAVALRGRVVDEAGAGVFGAVVQPALLPSEGTLPLPVSARAATSIDGSFELAEVPPGLYRICAQKPGSELLDPCEWGDKAPRVSLDGTQSVEGLRVVMETGDLLRVAVDDPGEARNLLTQDRARRSTVLFLAVRGSEGPRRLTLLRDMQSGAEYGTAIPKNRDIEVFVAGVNLEINGRVKPADAVTSVPARGAVFAITKQRRAEKPAAEPHLTLTLTAKPEALE